MQYFCSNCFLSHPTTLARLKVIDGEQRANTCMRIFPQGLRPQRAKWLCIIIICPQRVPFPSLSHRFPLHFLFIFTTSSSFTVSQDEDTRGGEEKEQRSCRTGGIVLITETAASCERESSCGTEIK